MKKDTLHFKTDVITVISNRIETEIFNSPVSINLLNAKEIKKINGDKLSDVLEKEQNIFIKSYGGKSALKTVSLNGLGAEHTIILLDGNKLNSFQNSQFDLSLISKENIDKIEIMPSGSSSIYGSEAVGGVINIITKDNFQIKNNNIKTSIEYGSYNYKKYLFNLNKTFNKYYITANYELIKSDENFKYYYNDGVNKYIKERLNDGFTFQNISIGSGYILNEKSKLKISSNYIIQKSSLPGIETGTPVNPSYQDDYLFNNNLNYNLKVLKNLNISSDLNYQNNLTNYYDNIKTDEYFKNIVISNTTRANFDLNKFHNVFGYDISYSTLLGVTFDNNIKRVQTSFYFSTEYSVNNNIKLFPSIRAEYISDIDRKVLTGKFGVNIKPFEKIKLNIRSSVGNNFRAPALNDLYWKSYGNPNLIPETSVNFDAGLIFGFNLIAENKIEANYNYISLDNKIAWIPVNSFFWSPFNIGKSLSKIFNITFETKKDLAKYLSFNFSYNYTYNSSLKKSKDYEGDLSYNKQLIYIPIELSKMKFGTSFNNKYGINLFYSFTGKRYSDMENKNQLPVIDLLDGNIFVNFSFYSLKIESKFEVNNILNEDYQVMPGYPMPLRNYKIGLSIIY